MLAVSGSALGVETQPGEVEAKFDARFSPQRLSPSKRTPLSPWVSMRFRNSDDTYPPALKEFEIEEDRHLRLNLEGVPVCSRGTVESPPMRQRCKKAVIGRGEMNTLLHFPEAVPILVRSEVTVYNAGIRNGVRTLLMEAFITIPTPAEIVTTVKVRHSNLGRYGLKLVGSVPKIAGGAGSITSLAWRFHKGIFSATCPADRRLDTRFNTTFADGTRLGGAVIRACTPAP